MGIDPQQEEKLLEPTLVPEFGKQRIKHVSAGWMHTVLTTGTLQRHLTSSSFPF